MANDQAQNEASSTGRTSPAKQAAMRVGTDLNAKWHIDKVVGVGGMGAVFAATHKNNGTRAAIKVLHINFATNGEIKERFLREGRIANRVEHPARVAVVDDGESSLGEPFLVMELLEGMTLADLCRKTNGRLPLEKVFGVFDTVLELLAKCHAVDIIHRDIKPANIFLTRQGPVRVLDFGVARMREVESEVQATRAGVALGTASFIAPEQALGMEKIDGRADLFSVGACFYTALTSERLHAAKSEAEEFVLAATEAAPSVARKAKDLPAEVIAYVDKALAYDKQQRFQTAEEMRSELLRLLAIVRSGGFKTKKQTGVVVRGKDAIDEGAPLETPEAIREAQQKLASIFKQLSLAMAGVRQYGFRHPQTERALAQSRTEIAAALAQNSASVRWDVTTTGFTFEGVPIWLPDRVPFDRIPHQLFADGIRKVQFKAGIDDTEIRDFLAILLRDASNLFGAEDDSVTAMWDRRFEHVAYLAVDSFAEGDMVQPGEEVAEWNELTNRAMAFARLDKDFDDADPEAQAAELNIAAALEEAGAAAAQLSVDPLTRATLGAQIATTHDRWLEGYLLAFVPAYAEAENKGDAVLLHDALREWTADQVKLHSVDRVFALHDAMTEAFREARGDETGRVMEERLARLMFPLDTLRAILNDLAAERWSNEAAPVLTARELLLGLERALNLLASDAVFALACECMGSSRSAALGEVLVPYIRKWSPGKESIIGSMLKQASAELGSALVDILASLKTTEAQIAMEAGLAHPLIEVKLAVLAHTGETLGDRAREEITALLDVDDPDVRARCLDLVVKLSVVAAGPVLVRRIQSDGFHELAVDERRRWLKAVGSLKAARAEALAIELLQKRRVFASDAVEASRALAAEHLADAESEEASKALEEATKSRWGASQTVRDAAARALASVRARQARRSSTEAKA